ncbi:MAG: MFS transporter [Chitinophagaceae bacterium]|nr:MAG: MFS transporter [Chitinophagaceae bacterium]
MGLPFVALSAAASIMYKDFGVSDRDITFWTSMIMWPYTLNFFWSPLLEMYRTKKFFVYATQAVTGVLFGLVALSLHLPNYFAVSIAVMAVLSFSGATHDVAANGLYLDALDEKNQAKFVGWQGAFYNVAKVFASGLIVYLAGIFQKSMSTVQAWTIVLFLYGGVMCLLALYNARVLPSGSTAAAVQSRSQSGRSLRDVLVSFFKKPLIWLSIIFIIFYRFAEGQAIKVVPLFLKAEKEKGGLSLTNEDFGLLVGVFGTVAFILGSIAGGHYVSKKGLNRRILLFLCAVFNLPFIAYALLAIFQPQSHFMIGLAISLEHFGYGFGFVGLILYIMQVVAPGPYKMAHYAFGSAVANAGFLISSSFSGQLSDWLGYHNFFIWVMFATIPAFLVTWLVPLPKKTEETAPEEATAEASVLS